MVTNNIINTNYYFIAIPFLKNLVSYRKTFLVLGYSAVLPIHRSTIPLFC